MPTARELLEQADALMRRRNLRPEASLPPAPEAAQGPATDSRFGATDTPVAQPRPPAPQAPPAPQVPPPGGSPPTGAAGPGPGAPSAASALSALRWSAPVPGAARVTTSPVFTAPPVRSPRTIQREPITPSMARTALPVDPAEPPMFGAPVTETAPAVRTGDVDFPVLTDAVPAEELAQFDERDDVPVLTEAVDAVDATAGEPILGDLDVPSVWSPTFGAAPTVARPAPAPPPAAVAEARAAPGADGAVPAVADATAAAGAGRDPLGLDQPPPGFEPPRSAQLAAPMPAEGDLPVDERPADFTVDERALPSIADEAPPEHVVAEEPSVAIAETELAAAPEAVEPAAESAAPDWTEAAGAEMPPPTAWTETEGAELPPPTAATAMPAAAEAAGAHVAPLATTAAPAGIDDVHAEVPPSPAATAAPLAAAPLDDARVREIAEEIGMQVLQRIDIFTDTELRARLGERLKPVVDRASADLVAAINQQVGELLRVFVADAIGKEIDRWRDRQS